jgi:hypothetical protein
MDIRIGIGPRDSDTRAMRMPSGRARRRGSRALTAEVSSAAPAAGLPSRRAGADPAFVTFKRTMRRAIARGVMDGVYESVTGKPLFKEQKPKRGPKSFRGRRTRKDPVRLSRWMR